MAHRRGVFELMKKAHFEFANLCQVLLTLIIYYGFKDFRLKCYMDYLNQKNNISGRTKQKSDY